MGERLRLELKVVGGRLISNNVVRVADNDAWPDVKL